MSEFGNAIGLGEDNIVKIALCVGRQIAVGGQGNQNRKIGQIGCYQAAVNGKFFAVLPVNVVPFADRIIYHQLGTILGSRCIVRGTIGVALRS